MKGLTSVQKSAIVRMVRNRRLSDRPVTMEALVRRGYATWTSAHQVAIYPTEAARRFAETGEQLPA